ncbi:hypothetical protein ACFW2Y_00010 [Streptomyces sp. NPDC058877]|uniref:type II toxin-antitoxin system Phd/YefM family antitoxin n=1 Tax=Streptomyces sp. NPDC058877 TaxID=3346665 RepID=UPI00367E28CB
MGERGVGWVTGTPDLVTAVRSAKQYLTYVSSVPRAGHEPVAVVSLEDHESLEETAYLLRSPANARCPLASLGELENGGGTVRELTTGTGGPWS